MITLVCAHFDPVGNGRQRIKNNPIGGGGVLSRLSHLSGLEMPDGGAEHPPRCVVERHIQMGLRGLSGIQSPDDIAGDDQRPVFSLKPDFLDADHWGVDTIQRDVGHVGRSPEGRGTAGQAEDGNGSDENSGHGLHVSS